MCGQSCLSMSCLLLLFLVEIGLMMMMRAIWFVFLVVRHVYLRVFYAIDAPFATHLQPIAQRQSLLTNQSLWGRVRFLCF
jgi:hypothetical protein